MPNFEVLNPENSPAPIGAYSRMIKAGTIIWGSALAGVDQNGKLAGDTVYRQANQALRVIAEMLDASDSGLDHVVSITVFLKDMSGYDELNQAFRERFTSYLPTRSVVAVADVPKPGALLTMNFVAVTKSA